jgi:1,4-dihydroxy-6-naphthoate synthase
MSQTPRVVRLGHSPDPDDVFMWWPLTGKIAPPEATDPFASGDLPPVRVIEPPRLDGGDLRFAAVPADVEALNRRAALVGDLEITALSVRAWPDVRDRYVITRCGASFGDGFGPKIVARQGDGRIRCEGCLRKPDLRIAVPGRRTTAFLMLGMVLGCEVASQQERFVEMPFEQIIGAVARGEVDAGLVIHEGQLTFADAELRLVLDVGEWWKEKTGLKLPLGINAVRRDLAVTLGPGAVERIAALLRESVAYSMARWKESVRYTLPFAEANVRRGGRQGGEAPTLERVDRYCRMYVSEETRDMGEEGREAIRRLFIEGAAAGLCEDPGMVDLV